MVLIRVDFPRPVCPARDETLDVGTDETSSPVLLTNTDDVELKASLQQLLFDLLCDAVETNVTSGKYSIPLRHGRRHFGLLLIGAVSMIGRRIVKNTQVNDDSRNSVDTGRKELHLR